MGNSSQRGPKTEKNTQNGSTSYLRYGLCEMQGWRSTMEDAIIAAVEFDTNSSVFGVMDGHGGSLISKFVACNFISLLTHMKSFKQKNYEQALIETYLKFDELLRLEKVNQFLKFNILSKKESRLDITFSYGLQSEKSNDPSINFDEVAKIEDGKFSDQKENNSKRVSHNSSNSDKLKQFPKENIIDLTKKEKETNLSPSAGSSDNSQRGSDGNDTNSRSKETLTLDNRKIEISMRNSHYNSDNYEGLIAKDMGTTANILLIKNNYLYLANVGDSMSVIFKNGIATRLNQEHKTTLLSEFTRINKSGARIIHNRIEGRLNLTRAIGKILKINIFIQGDLNFKNNPNLKFYEQAVTAYPEITKMKITKDIDFIIMACDGVWDCVDIQKLCEHISMKLKSNEKISDIIAELLDQIISKTNNTPVGTDNMSCIIIQFLHD